MSSKPAPVHIHVMDSNETRQWYQPIRPLREWFQESLIGKVRRSAVALGRSRVCIYDAAEQLLWRGNLAPGERF